MNVKGAVVRTLQSGTAISGLTFTTINALETPIRQLVDAASAIAPWYAKFAQPVMEALPRGDGPIHLALAAGLTGLLVTNVSNWHDIQDQIPDLRLPE